MHYVVLRPDILIRNPPYWNQTGNYDWVFYESEGILESRNSSSTGIFGLQIPKEWMCLFTIKGGTNWQYCVLCVIWTPPPPLPEYCRGIFFGKYCWTLGNIFQIIWTGSFNIIYIHCVNTINGSIYNIRHISGKWLLINAHIPKITGYCRYFRWTWFDNIIYPREIIYITTNRGTEFNRTLEV